MRVTLFILVIIMPSLFSDDCFSQAINMNYQYDNLNRIQTIAYPSGTSVSYTYDAAGNRIAVQVNGVEFKADVTPRSSGKKDGTIIRQDWDQMGRFAMGLDAIANQSELQRADCAPFETSGNGKVDVFDWVQSGRFFAGLDDLVPAASGVVAALAMPATIKPEAGTRAVRIVSTTLQRGQVNEIKIEFDAQGDENALAFSLNFDPALLTFTNAALGTGATGAQLIVNPNQAANGRVGFGLALNPSQTFTAGTKSILTLQFQATSGTATTTTLSFGDQPVARGVADIYANSLSTMYTDATLTVNGDTKPAPAITAINPTIAVAGSAGFTLTVTGKDFLTGAVVYWGTKPLPTAFTSSTSLSAAVSAAELATQGTVNVSVVNPAPNSATSNGLPFTISAPPTNRRLQIVSTTGSVGSVVTVPLDLVSEGDVGAVGFSLSFDPTVLSNPTMTLGSDAPTSTIVTNTTQLSSGRLGVVIAAPPFQPYAAGTRRLAQVSFNLIAGTPGTVTTIDFVDSPVKREMINAASLTIPGSFLAGTVTVATGYEADVAPRPNGTGNGTVTIADWVQLGRFVAALDIAANGSEFQRADSAPRASLGDGKISVTDWVQAGRYAAGLDPVVAAGGPTSLTALALSESLLPAPFFQTEVTRTMRAANASFARGQIGSLSIQLDAQGGENAAAFSLNFDPTRLTFVDAKAGSDANGAAVQVNVSQAATGKLGLAVALPTGQMLAAGTRSLLTVRFIPAGGEGDATTTVSFGDQLVRRELADVNAASVANVTYSNAAITLTGKAVATVSAADYNGGEQAAESIVSAFGSQLSSTTQGALTLPLPISLGGSQVIVRDSQGKEHFAPMFYVSPLQINFQIPAAAAEGIATVTVFSSAGPVTTGLLVIGKVAPAIFTADSTGKGFAAGSVLYVNPNNVRQEMPLSRYDANTKQHVAVPVDASDPNVQVFLTLYGTGLRKRGSLANVQARIGGVTVPVEYAGAQGEFAGLDQINLRIPAGFAVRGETTIELMVEGKTANPVRVTLR